MNPIRILNREIECDEGFIPKVIGFYIIADNSIVINVQIGYCKFYNFIAGNVDELKNKVISFE